MHSGARDVVSGCCVLDGGLVNACVYYLVWGFAISTPSRNPRGYCCLAEHSTLRHDVACIAMHRCHAPCTAQLAQPKCHSPPMHRCHARPGLPVVPDPNLTPPNIASLQLHDTAAKPPDGRCQMNLAMPSWISKKTQNTQLFY